MTDEQQRIQSIYRSATARTWTLRDEGKTPGEIAAALNAEGVEVPHDAWTDRHVLILLSFHAKP